ncbi:hypothetical protein Sgri01_05735 [Streptomyces griseus]
MADVRLDRADPQGTVHRTVSVRGDQGLCLDRVAQHGARAVGLDRVDVGGGQGAVGQRRPDHPLLRRTVRRRQTVRRAVLVDRGPADHGEHRMAVPTGVGEPFQQQDRHALAPRGAVGPRGERLAAAVRCQAALAAEADERTRGAHHGDAAGQGERALLAAQCLARQVNADQGGRAGGVDGHRGAFEAERVRHPPGQDARRVSGGGEVLAVGHVGEQALVVLAVGSGEHPGAGAAQRPGVDPGAFEHLPRRFEELALLRVHRQRLARADPEEPGVELGRVGQESALPDVRGARPVRRGVQPGEVPASVRGEVAHRVDAVREQRPEILG